MSSEMVKMNEAVVKIDNAIERGMAAGQLAGQMSRALALAGAIQDIRDLLTPDVMKPIMALQGTAIGFKTDKDGSGGYPEKVIKDCVLEAVLNGVYPCGNEFNVIAGRAYITKEGMGRKLKSINGLSYSITPSVPSMKDGGAVIEMAIEYSYNGESKTVKLPVCVRVNSGMGADAIIGKATRKARAWLYQAVTGQEVAEGDAEDAAMPMKNVTPKASPFEKPIEAKIEKIVEDAKVEYNPAPDVSRMSYQELMAAVERVRLDNDITDEMLANWDKEPFGEKDIPTLRRIVKDSAKWVESVRKCQPVAL